MTSILAERPDTVTLQREPLRVLVVTESFLPQINGVTNSVRRVLEHLAEQGHDAMVLAPTAPESGEYMGFPVVTTRGITLPAYDDFRIGMESRKRFKKYMTEFDPDIVHVASPANMGCAATRAARDLGIPVVAIYQTDMVGFAKGYEDRYHVRGLTQAMAKLTRKIHRAADRNLAPSTASLTQLEELGVTNSVLWPRGVNVEQFHPSRRDAALRQRLAPNGELIVGYVGRLAVEKELELLEVFHNDPRYSLVLVGGGPDEERLRKLMPKAHFLGLLHGDELGEAYASLDVFVHTGRHETFCQAAQEGLASGLPVIAPNQGGPIDIVDHGVTGFLYTPGDRADLAGYVETLATDDLLRRSFARAARKAVEGRSWAAINARLIDHYREVIAEKQLSSATPRLRRSSSPGGSARPWAASPRRH